MTQFLKETDAPQTYSQSQSSEPFSPAYRIRTKRTIIRCWNPEDAPLLVKAINSNLDHLRAWLPWAKFEPLPITEKAQWLRKTRAEFDLDEQYTYAIFNLDETEVLGGTGLHKRCGENALEIGYWIHESHVNKGLATETSAALTKVAFEIHKVDRIQIACHPENHASAKVPQKLAYVLKGTTSRDDVTADSVDADTVVWSLSAKEYAHSPAATAEVLALDSVGRWLLGA